MAGLAASLWLGVWQADEARTALDVPLFALPVVQLPGLNFTTSIVYLAVVAALVNVVDELGVLIGTERLDDADWRRPNFTTMSKGLQASGLFTMVSGVLGGAAMGMSSANLSLAYATGVTSRIVAVATGVLIIGVTFMPVALKQVLSLPDPVVAGILFFAACYFIVSGAELALSRMLSPRRSLVIGLSVGVGVLLQSVPALTSRFAGTSLEHMLAPMTFATIVAIVLNLIMRIGVRQKETMIFPGAGHSVNADDIIEKLGERWGMHRQTGVRASAAMSETLELLGVASQGPIACTISYNELILVITFSYEGKALVLPHQPPSADTLSETPEGVVQMGAWIVRRLSDYSSVSVSGGKQHLRMAFEC
jgi:NCS2 family nucleobase:cation symporter-2